MLRSHYFKFFICGLILWLPARAWDYERHRLINDLALKSLPEEFPKFVLLAPNQERVRFLAGEPDRWRNTRDKGLRHLNNPDHYFDVEYLDQYKLKAEDLSHFRYRFVEQMANARTNLKLELPEANTDHTKNYPGFLPWSINENYLKLISSFSYLKVFEEMGTSEEINNAQANVIYRMGILSHFVGDTSQPLHTTKHFNGWVGDNPQEYTTRRSFHSWIDGKFFISTQPPNEIGLQKQLRTAQVLKRPESKELASGHFLAAVNYILEQHKLVEPLYQLDKAGNLSGDSPGKGHLFLEKQLLTGAQMLGDLWFTAWKEAPPDRFLQSYLAKRKIEKK